MSVKWYPAAGASEIPLKEGKKIIWKDFEVALFNLGGEFMAVDNRCPHKQGPLADGMVAGKAVFCPLHNWKINLENGCALSGGIGQVRKYPVKVIGDSICIAFEEGKLAENNPAALEALDERI